MKTMMAYSAFLLTPLLAVAQANYVAHEWGTFTTLAASDGRLLSGLYVDEERLPVYGLSKSWYTYNWDNKGWDPHDMSLLNVTTKMETPVIYFYWDGTDTLEVDTRVQWPHGSISQFFPMRDAGEIAQINNYWPEAGQLKEVDFATPYNGWIAWNAKVLPKGDTTSLTLETQLETWNAPRQTVSNLVQAGWNQTEKYLFYRGIGNMPQHLKTEFNDKGSLVISNGIVQVPFVMVYEFDSTDGVRIWWVGGLNAGGRRVVSRPELTTSSSEVEWTMEKLEQALVKEGLFEDEARAMLRTWETSYFHTDGLKVFWILPRPIVDQWLPITLQPDPSNLERVMVGRSEILTPEREAQIYQAMLSGELDSMFEGDRFYYAYLEVAERLANGRFSYTSEDTDMGIMLEPSKVVISGPIPNPASDRVMFVVTSDEVVTVDFRLFDIHGHLISTDNVEVGRWITSFEKDLSHLPAGVYVARVGVEDISESFRIVKLTAGGF